MTPGPAPDALLRPVLQLAVDVARAGAATEPAVEPPRSLRPFVRFRKLPDSALATVRRALDEDESFRARVGELADEAELGRAGWLYVARPDGWQEELAGLAGEAESRAESEREEREERSARRRVTAAEAAARRADAAAAKARSDADAAAAELAAERRERRAAQEEVARLTRRVGSLEGERDSARRRAEAAAAEAEALRAELESARARLVAEAAEAERLRARPAPPPVAVEAAFDVDGVASAVSAAASAAAALGRALADASAALAGAPAPAGAEAAPLPAVPPAERRAPPGPRPRRRPPALPPAVLDDTAEAAAHLVRVAGVLLVVDGYNAAKALWPDLAPVDLRDRLVGALAELEARTGASIHVVFDGADVGPPPRPTGRRPVRVTFSPAGVEADDVILDLLEDIPVDRPVVVASSDRRVQEGARVRGAAFISSAQLASVLHRS